MTAISSKPLDWRRMKTAAEQLKLNNLEAAWLFGVSEKTWYQWRRKDTQTRLGSLSILVALLEDAAARTLKPEKLHGFIGLETDATGRVYRPRSRPRTETDRINAWVYIARCARRPEELYQLELRTS